jgi:hypothetical protein
LKRRQRKRNCRKEGAMRKIVEITVLTLKRLQNYEQVVVRELKDAHKLQWMEMTLDRMEEFEVARRKVDRVIAAVGYASFLFRVQNGLSPARVLYGEQVLRNNLLDLLTELRIPVVMMEVSGQKNETANSG